MDLALCNWHRCFGCEEREFWPFRGGNPVRCIEHLGMKLSASQRGRLDKIVAELNEIVGGCSHPDGRPKTFAELEEECIGIGDLLTAAVLQQRVGQRPKPAGTCSCPTCNHSGTLIPEEEVRLLQTDRGEVSWSEPVYYCRRCRRTFFPSVG